MRFANTRSIATPRYEEHFRIYYIPQHFRGSKTLCLAFSEPNCQKVSLWDVVKIPDTSIRAEECMKFVYWYHRAP